MSQYGAQSLAYLSDLLGVIRAVGQGCITVVVCGRSEKSAELGAHTGHVFVVVFVTIESANGLLEELAAKRREEKRHSLMHLTSCASQSTQVEAFWQLLASELLFDPILVL